MTLNKFTEIKNYMLQTRDERRNHLKLSEDCIEIGGVTSVYFKGLLAHHLKTTIPHGTRVYLCHACNNRKCSNPNHLYWGTPHDNYLDAVENGTMTTIHERMLKKYGKKKTWELQSKAGKIAGKHQRKRKSTQTFTVIEKEKWELALKIVDLTQYGWVQRVADQLGYSHTHVKRIVDKHFSHYDRFKRNYSKSGDPITGPP